MKNIFKKIELKMLTSKKYISHFIVFDDSGNDVAKTLSSNKEFLLPETFPLKRLF